MDLRLLMSIFLVVGLIFPMEAQVFEHHEDRSYRNKYTDVVNVGDSMWVVSGSYNIMNGFYSGAYIKAFDATGTELWNSDSPLNVEYQSYNQLELLPNDNLVTFGVEQECCDCTVPFLQMHWHNAEGELLNQLNFESIEFFGEEMIVCQTESVLGIVYEQDWPTQSHVLATNFSGDSLWVTDLGEVVINDLISGNGNLLAVGDSVLFSINESGTLVDSIEYEDPPIDACSAFNHQPFVMWSDGVYEVLENGTLSLVIPNTMDSSAVEIFGEDDRLFIRYNDVILHYNTNFELTMTTPYDALPHWEHGSIASNQSTFALVGARHIHPPNLQTYRGAAIHTIDISGNQLEHFPDLAISNLEIISLNVEESEWPDDDLYIFSDGIFSGYLVNEGDVEVNSTFINYLSGYAVCNLAGNREFITNMGLAPGDSLSFVLTSVQEIVVLQEDSVSIEFCVFLSDPSNFYDRNGTNDEGCVSHTIYVGLSENEIDILSAYPNPASDRIRFDFSGQPYSARLQIFNGTGKIMTDHSLSGQNSHDQNVSDWPAGIYFARIVEEGKVSEPIKFSVVR